MRAIPHKLLWLGSLYVNLLLLGCGQEERIVRQYTGETMGTYFSVKWQDPLVGGNTQAPEVAIDNLLGVINQSMSIYLQDSELSQLNGSAVGEPVPVSRELAQVIAVAKEISEQTSGAFDFTVGPLVNLWGFGPGEERSVPPAQGAIDAARARIGYRYVELDRGTPAVTRMHDVEINLSAIAKGFAVDEIVRLMQSRGIEHYLVDIGGEVRAGGERDVKRPWRVGIERPDDARREIQLAIELKDRAVATSGNYRNYFEEWGVRYSHTIDPVTGRPVRHSLASVTVVMPECISADALATALMVMGPEEGRTFAENNAIAAYFIVKKGRGFEAFWTENFNDYLLPGGEGL